MSSADFITAFEYGRIEIDDAGTAGSVTAAEADKLLLLNKSHSGFCERGYGYVQLKQYCGLVNLGRRILEILPKVDRTGTYATSRGVLLRLLKHSEVFPAYAVPTGQQLAHSRLIDVFISAFLDAIAQIARGGLYREYRQHEDNLQVVRGRVLAEQQFATNCNRADRILCRFDDLTADNVWNRAIKAGLTAVRPWTQSGDMNRRWVELMILLDEVEAASLEHWWLDRLLFHRQTTRYFAAIQWVKWISRLLSPTLSAGRNAAPAVVFDMNVIFERAIANVLRRRAAAYSSLELSAQHRGVYLSNVKDAPQKRAFELRPDLLLKVNGDTVAIGDTKWKRLRVGASGHLMPETSDIYQLNAYASAFDCTDLALIYPWYDDLDGSIETALELRASASRKPTLSVICVDLTTDEFRLVRGKSTAGFEAFSS